MKLKFNMCAKSTDAQNILRDNFCWFLCEFLGTGMLLFLGCMGCIESDAFPNNNLTRSLNFGLVVLIIIQCFGCCSGAHLNPAVTLAAYFYDYISLPNTLAYVLAQILGAYCGYGLLKVFLPANIIFAPGSSTGFCMTSVHSSIDVWQALGIEFCITSALIFVCCGAWDPRNKNYQDAIGIKFGLAVACLSITAGPVTGASMNPARSMGPAIWHNNFRNQWIYWVGPLAASVVAANVYKYFFRRECSSDACEKLASKMDEVRCP